MASPQIFCQVFALFPLWRSFTVSVAATIENAPVSALGRGGPVNGATGAIMDAQQADAKRVTKLKISGITIGIAIVIPILLWKWGLL